MEYKFQSKWDEFAFAHWQRSSRVELNKIIEVYNQWQIEDNFDKDKSRIVLAKIEYGKQTIGSQDGGSGYLECLLEMENFVKERLNQTNV